MSPEPMGIVVTTIIVVGAILMGLVLAIVFNVIPFWMICKKAGFPAPLALLMLVPVANLILPFYIAFASWPALRQRDDRPAQ
jgi:hypothetical protein